MVNIDLKLKTYEQLQNEIITLNTNNYLKDLKIKCLQQRIDKAVEYIENHTENIDRGRYYEDYVETYKLLNILKGGDTND